MNAKTATLELSNEQVTDVWQVGEESMPEEAIKTDAETRADAIAEALNEDADAYLMIYLQPDGGKNSMEFVKRIPADKYDMGELYAFLQQNFGGGDYRVMLRANGKLKANKLITIAKSSENTAPSQTGEMGQFMSGIMTQMREMQNQMLELSREKQTGGTSRQDMMQEMILMKNLFSNENSGGGSMITQLRDLMALQGEMSGMLPAPAEKDDSGFAELLDKATPLFEALLNSNQNQPQQPTQNPTQKLDPQREKQKQMYFMLKMGIASLIKSASKNADSATCAEWIIDQMPENLIKGLVSDSNAVKKLVELNPKVKQYVDWFAMTIEHVKAQLGMPSAVSAEYDPLDSETVDTSLTPDKGGDTVAANGAKEPGHNEQPT